MTDTIAKLKALLADATPGPLVADAYFMQGDHGTRIAFKSRYGVPGETVGEALQNWNEAERTDERISWKQAEANAKLWAMSPTLAAALIEAVEALEGLLNCPAIADGDLGSDVWGCPESAAAEYTARDALTAITNAMETDQ